MEKLGRVVTQLTSQESVSKGVVEQTVDPSVRQVPAQTVEEVNVVPQECLPQHTGQQTVDVPVPQAFKRAATKNENLLGKVHLDGVTVAPIGGATFDIDEDVEKASAQDKFAGEPNQISVVNERVLPAETDRVAQETERFRGEDEVNKEKMERQHSGSRQQRGGYKE